MFAFRRFALLAAALAPVAAAAPAFAQQAAPVTQAPPANPDADVTVTGTLEREEAIRDFVRALTPGPAFGQLSRFEESICPAAFGLAGAAKAAVEARMRRVATAVGLTLGSGNCRPNVLLMVTRDKRALLERLVRTHPHFFGEDPENSPRQLIAEPGRAVAWHASAEINADGRALPTQGGFRVNQTTRRATRISEATRPAFFAAAVVIEQDALPGLSVNQLADYTMMRALARTDPQQLTSAGASQRTILSVLEAAPDAEVPPTLTTWDLGFLRGLYASTANLRTAQQRGEIQRRVGSELDRRDGARD